jgi:hypothetical protein
MVNVDNFNSVEEIKELIAQLRTRKRNIANGGDKIVLRRISTLQKKT